MRLAGRTSPYIIEFVVCKMKETFRSVDEQPPKGEGSQRMWLAIKEDHYICNKSAMRLLISMHIVWNEDPSGDAPEQPFYLNTQQQSVKHTLE